MSSPARVWFITGASTGFGRSVTELALKSGDVVVATLRKPEMLADLVAKYPPTQLLVLPLDVTRPSEISAAFSKALEAFGRIDIVFNNAGYYVVAEAEGLSEENARGMFEVMFWGAANVTKEAIRCFRDINKPHGGRLLQVSSRRAWGPAPGSVHYAAAKAALECLTEGYVAELDPHWNIKITLIEPGLFRTAATNCIIEPVHPSYQDPSLPTMKYRSLYPGVERLFTGDPDKLALAMLKLVGLEDPPLHLPLHKVALEGAREKAEILLRAANDFASWSDDIYVDE
ncbi:NAD(P)-binding protein [Leucogyrophana mollusca]|uniref:NAD(P)-binding protein n=1 Tax=Leucogyrophana mollusca TaxID=85980 RepID=A0ACB8BFL0_9AGAM|nr:NAD(P)-binding protein [Leucogyrophana mollusca]